MLALWLGIVAAAALNFADTAAAQVPAGAVPPTTTSPIERVQPEVQPRAAPRLLQTPVPAAPEVQAGPPVTVQAVEIEGGTVYSANELAPFYANVVGREVPLSQVAAILEQIQTKYRNDGYFLTVVRGAIEPVGDKQTLRIRVIEGFISDVKIDGDIGPAGTLVYKFLSKLTSIRPVNIDDVERALLLSQDIPGVSIRAVLRPGAGEPGAVELVGQVGRQPFGALFQYDNRGPTFAGPHEILLGGYANSFTSTGERTEVILYDTPWNKEQVFGQVAVEGFVGSSGLKLRAYTGYGPSFPEGSLLAIGYHTRLLVAGVSTSYPLIRTRPVSLSLSLAFDVTQSTIHSDGVPVQLSDLRMVRVGENLNFQDDTLFGLIAANSVALTGSKGIDAFGASHSGAADAPRAGNRTDFTKISGELTRVQNLFTVFGDLLALKLSAGGQFTSDILPPSEKYFLGGTRFGRGFFSGEVTGDRAIGTTAELQFNTGIEKPFHLGLQFYTFYDNGLAFNLAPGDLDPRVESAGAGVRATITPQLSLEFELAHRFTRHPTGVNVPREGGEEGFFTLIARY